MGGKSVRRLRLFRVKLRAFLQKIFRPLLLAFVGLLVSVEVLVFLPRVFDKQEEKTVRGMFKSLPTMVEYQRPNDAIQYTMDGVHYYSVEGDLKRSEMIADHAVVYEKSQTLQAKNARIKMYDSNDNSKQAPTVVTGRTANYDLKTKDIDLIDNVFVTFPDGFSVKTNKAHYSHLEDLVRTNEDFFGTDQNKEMLIWGTGLIAPRKTPILNVEHNVRAKIVRGKPTEHSDVTSDRSNVDRAKKVAYFMMDDPSKLVQSHMGTLLVRSKEQEMTYGSKQSTGPNGLQFMVAKGEVYLQETDVKKLEDGMKYSTCQRADFISEDDKVILSGFPSVYQETDTLTGEIITIYRTKNLVEVSHANGIHETK